MKGRWLLIAFFVVVLAFASGLFYAINFLHYSESYHENYEVAGLEAKNYRQIDATTSPIKFRACFELPEGTSLYGSADDATPLVAPYWFDCFDAKTLSLDLENGKAHAVRFDENKPFGVTSFMIVYPDGKAYMWRQLNECGEAKFAGDPLPDHCPDQEINNG